MIKEIETRRAGLIKIFAEFQNEQQANANGFFYAFTEGKYDIYTKYYENNRCLKAVVVR